MSDVQINDAIKVLEKHILGRLRDAAQSGGEFCFLSLRVLNTEIMGVEVTRGILREMRQGDLVTFSRGLFTESGEVAGSGYAITPDGRDYLRALELERQDG